MKNDYSPVWCYDYVIRRELCCHAHEPPYFTRLLSHLGTKYRDFFIYNHISKNQ